MSKRAYLFQALLFTVFLVFFFIVNLVSETRGFSERENRYLAKAPDFSFSSLFSGKFTSDFEEYVKDQFAFRDAWVTLKARSELVSGKKENRGVYMCADGTLIQNFKKPDYSLLDQNISALNDLTASMDIPVYYALIPGAAHILSDKLPKGAPSYSQAEVISYAYAKTSSLQVDIASKLMEHKDEYIFYRTDHHWTTLGAYYGYLGIMDAFGITPSPIDRFTREAVSNDFFGTLYSSSGFSWVPADSIEIFAKQNESVQVINYPQGDPVTGALYDASFLDKKDKYSFFMGGNTPLLQIDTGRTELPSILILRDSYMDSLTPFLLEHFSKIHIIDLRYYISSLKEYIDNNNIDNILACYSVNNFSTDNSLFLLSR